MTATGSYSPGARTPVHLWIVGALSLVWNGLGCCDYLMTNMRIAPYIAHLAPDTIDFLDALPGWLVVAWAVQVGCSFLGSLLLLCRSLWAAYAFAISLVLMAASQAYQLGVGLPQSMNTGPYWSLVGAIWAVALFLLFYSLRMRARRILR